MRLRYTPEALAELDWILTHIVAVSPQGARRVRSRIQAITTLLLQFPNSGQVTAVPEMRRLVATPYPYVISYQMIDDEVVIVGVRHSARDSPAKPEHK